MSTASKERIQRVKQETRCNILQASLSIAKEDGWNALSMRKVADRIQYTAPMIYEYFSNKEAILKELTKMGYNKLNAEMLKAKQDSPTPEAQLEAMWLTYWNFAFKDTELYQLMFGVEMNCCVAYQNFPEAEETADMICDVIEILMPQERPTEDEVCMKYYLFWSVVHGLISINLTRGSISDDINKQILKDAITGIIRSIKG